MIENLKKLMNNNNSSFVAKKNVVDKFIKRENFTYLISFPRTGSHWLRMLMELYFDKPSLVRIFYKEHKDANEFTCYHTHDLDLEIRRRNVIYLYRALPDTIYSQLRYHNENTCDRNNISKWSYLYSDHLMKWLVSEKFTKLKTIIKYENMKADLPAEFSKVCSHFGKQFNQKKFDRCSAIVTKAQLKEKSRHDKHVVNLKNEYILEKIKFIDNYSNLIYEYVTKRNSELKRIFCE